MLDIGDKRLMNRVLDVEDVRLWRKLYQEGMLSSRQIMQVSNLSMSSVMKMLRGETYRDVGEIKGEVDVIRLKAHKFALKNGMPAESLDLTPLERKVLEMEGLIMPGMEKLRGLARKSGDGMVKELGGMPDPGYVD
jgi:hypothetical protein